MNGYILVDAASSKKKGSDFTAMHVVGLNVDRKRYVLDMVRDRLNLKERGDRLFALHRKWSAAGLKLQPVRYERYGLMADVEHLHARMEAENYRFKIVEVGGITSKHDRIKRLIPLYEQGEIWMPEFLYATDWQGLAVDLVRAFIEEEYMAFPVGLHEDMLDALSRMEEPELKLVWPAEESLPPPPPPTYAQQPSTAWMA
jgi:predicted phage terminase large subunit-like protein